MPVGTGTTSQSSKKLRSCLMAEEIAPVGVRASVWIQHSKGPPMALAFVPSIWIWMPASRRTRVAQLQFTDATTPPASSRLAKTLSSTSTS
jgi:hypothetical protein